MKFPVLLQRFWYVTYKRLTMLYMNSATRTISVVWNVQPRQCKTSLPLLFTFTVKVWGNRQRDTSWNKGENYISSCLLGNAMAQALSHRPVITEVWIWSNAFPCGIPGGWSSTWEGFLQSCWDHPHQCHSTSAPCSVTNLLNTLCYALYFPSFL
jgi:hypothetical protein